MASRSVRRKSCGDGNYHFDVGWTFDGTGRYVEVDPAGNVVYLDVGRSGIPFLPHGRPLQALVAEAAMADWFAKADHASERNHQARRS